MNPGEARSSRRATPARGLLILALAAGLAGCASGRASVEKNLMADRNSARRSAGVAENYHVACPDVLDVRIADWPELSAKYLIGPDGRIDLGDCGTLRLEGRSLPEVARLIADETGQPTAGVQVRVAVYRSQFVLLSGQVVGWQRTVPYQGQETVLDLLQRVGGITPGAEPGDVYVVRAHLGDNQRPEMFHVDLKAIVMKRDDTTNIRLMPFDQVYVGGTRQAELEKAFPPWLRPVYQAFWNMLPTAQRRPPPDPALPPRWVTGS
jgi:polysaccharide export outer membrane protein